MCLLTVFYPYAEVNEDNLEEASFSNPDGFGFAILMGDHIAKFRSMNYYETVEHFLSLRERYPDTFALFHHRFATGGGNTTENCHPFTWGFDEKFAIGHNGVLPITPGRRKSDTRIWTEHNLADVSPKSLDDNVWFAKVEQWLGSSKVAVLSASNDTEYGLYIMNEHLGHWDGDVWYSNYSYQRYVAPSRPFSFNSGYDQFAPSRFSLPISTEPANVVDVDNSKEWVVCSQCFNYWEVNDNFDNLVCKECDTCWICEQSALSCDCCVDGVCSVQEERSDAIAKFTD